MLRELLITIIFINKENKNKIKLNSVITGINKNNYKTIQLFEKKDLINKRNVDREKSYNIIKCLIYPYIN